MDLARNENVGARTLRVVGVLVALLANACAINTYRGSARPTLPQKVAAQPGWSMVVGMRLQRQPSRKLCGAAAVAMVLAQHGIHVTPQAVGKAVGAVGKRGIKASALRDYLRARGLDAFVIRGTRTDLEREMRRGRPVIVGIVEEHILGFAPHYEVLVGIRSKTSQVVSLDPGRGWEINTWRGFAGEWKRAGRVAIVALPRERALLRKREPSVAGPGAPSPRTR